MGHYIEVLDLSSSLALSMWTAIFHVHACGGFDLINEREVEH